MDRGVFPAEDWLRRRAELSPDKTAVVTADESTYSYLDFDRAVSQTAGGLTNAGCEPGSRVAIACTDSLTIARLVCATVRIGATAVPINTRLAADTLAARIRRADPTALIVDTQTLSALPPESQLPVLPIQASELSAAGAAETTFDLDRSPSDPWVLLYTSGTTGQPDLVTLTEQNLRASAIGSAFRLGIATDERWFDPLPLYHMGGLAPLFRSVLYGTTVVLTDGFEPARAHRRMRSHDVTGISVVPTMLQDLLAVDKLPNVRFVLCGGAATPPDLVMRCTEANIPIYPTYGMTETASQIATATPEEAAADPETVGRPIFGVDISIVTSEGECPPGTPGEIVVSGPVVTPAYYDDSEGFEERTGQHGFHTGDRGLRRPDGQLVVLGRTDRTIVSGGENVNPTEVSEVINSHPGVRDVAVVGVCDDRLGQRVGAAVTGDVTPEAVHLHCRERLAGFKLPRLVSVTDSLPRTPSGTIDYEAVTELVTDSGTSFDPG